MYRMVLCWWLFFCLFALGLFGLTWNGTVAEIYMADTTYICILIFSLLLYCTVECGLSIGAVDTIGNRFNEARERIKVHPDMPASLSVAKDLEEVDEYTTQIILKCSFIAGSCASLGMIGTIWGMIQMMKAITQIDLADIDLEDFASSMGIALYTTLVGLFARLLIRIQVHTLSENKRKLDNDIQTCR